VQRPHLRLEGELSGPTDRFALAAAAPISTLLKPMSSTGTVADDNTYLDRVTAQPQPPALP
jgi:hypothetical protein